MAIRILQREISKPLPKFYVTRPHEFYVRTVKLTDAEKRYLAALSNFIPEGALAKLHPDHELVSKEREG